MENAKYRMLLESLKKDILGGKYTLEQPFPSVRALSRRFGLANTTVQRAVEALVQQGLVQRSQGAGSVVTRTGALRKIGLIVPGIAVSEFFRPVVTTLIRLAQENGYTLLFGETYSNDPAKRVREARELAAEMIKNHVAGVLYQPFEAASNGMAMNQRILSVLDAKKIPVVLLDRDAVMPPERTAHDLVAINNVDAGERLARHMVAAGARRIGFLTRFTDVPNIESRLRGFLCAKAVLESQRVRFEVFRGAADDKTFIRRKMKGRNPPDAIVCDSDTTAAMLRQTLGDLGYSVPDDVRIAGFDDVRLASLMTPPLTTIRQPCEEIAEQAFRRLLARVQKPDLVPLEILIAAPLVVRASTMRRGGNSVRENKAKEKAKRRVP